MWLCWKTFGIVGILFTHGMMYRPNFFHNCSVFLLLFFLFCSIFQFAVLFWPLKTDLLLLDGMSVQSVLFSNHPLCPYLFHCQQFSLLWAVLWLKLPPPRWLIVSFYLIFFVFSFLFLFYFVVFSVFNSIHRPAYIAVIVNSKPALSSCWLILLSAMFLALSYALLTV